MIENHLIEGLIVAGLDQLTSAGFIKGPDLFQ